MRVSDETAAWALKQMHHLETAVRELNEKNAELEAELTHINGFGCYRSGEKIECLKGAEDVGVGSETQDAEGRQLAEKP